LLALLSVLYSSRSAVMGSTRIARRDGTNPAASSKSEIARNVAESVGVISNSIPDTSLTSARDSTNPKIVCLSMPWSAG